MTRKTEITLSVLVLLVLALVLFLLFRTQSTPKTDVTDGPSTTATTDTTTDTTTTPPAPQHATAPTVARIFVERFGSYSTDVDYANVTDVLPVVTDTLAARLQDIAEKARKTGDGDYYGVSTNVIKITTNSTSDTAATVTVKTQREEAFGTPGNTTVRYQDIRVEFVKSGEDWLVNDFTWL